MSELAALLELLGEDATMKLLEGYAGVRVNVPKAMPAAHKLKDLLGESDFALLWQYFGGSEIAVPVARAWRIGVYLKRGLKPREIARRCGCGERVVYFYQRGGKSTLGQMSLALE